MSVQILVGDCRDMLKTLPDASVQTVVTSPPYYGLRDYGEDDQIGLEETPEAYIAELVDVFREVRRVLRDDGTVWLNLGDSYSGAGAGGGGSRKGNERGQHDTMIGKGVRGIIHDNLKPKDLIGIPWRVALALQADGWYLRSDIIWHKPNPMPESVTDRPTKAHEYVFLLSKAARYFYDADAVKEDNAINPNWNYGSEKYRRDITTDDMREDKAHLRPKSAGPGWSGLAPAGPNGSGRNRRSVWSIATKPYSGAHFAVMPPDLVEPCIKAGTSERGACPECGAPWERGIAAKTEEYASDESDTRSRDELLQAWALGEYVPAVWNIGLKSEQEKQERIWYPTCDCDAGDPVPCVVLDPFGGAGTVGLVADRLGRDAILIELNADYAEMARRRIVNDAPMFARVEVK